MGISVSIIIVNYHSLRLVRNCISSIIERTTLQNYEIIVVDNNSEDIHELQSLADNIKLLQLGENLGFGKANNKGVDVSSGEYLFFLNPDTYLINDAVSILYEAMVNNKKIGICGGNLYDANERPIHSFNDISLSFSFINKLMTTSPQNFRHIGRQHNLTTNQKEVGYITGADLMIKREVFNDCGQFPKNIFMYYEDVYLCYRVKCKGLKIMSIPNAKIVHLEGQSLPEENNESYIKKRTMNIIGQKTFLKENHSKAYSLSLIIYSLCALYVRLTVMRILGMNTYLLKKSIQEYKQLLHLYNE